MVRHQTSEKQLPTETHQIKEENHEIAKTTRGPDILADFFEKIQWGGEKPNEVKEKNYLNTASALIKQSIYEMEIFVEHLKGKKETVKGLAGLGDLYVSSGGGRNAKMGSYIGEGLTFSEAKKKGFARFAIPKP